MADGRLLPTDQSGGRPVDTRINEWTQEAGDVWELLLPDGRWIAVTRHGSFLNDQNTFYRVVKAPRRYEDFPTLEAAQHYAETFLIAD
jgi:hypothetical protein